MERKHDGRKVEPSFEGVEETQAFGTPDSRRRLLWAVIRVLSERSDNGADWNDVLDEAEKRGIDRSWAHKEVKRRLEWGDAHLYDGNLHPHYQRRCHVDLWYRVTRAESQSADLAALNTSLDEKEAIQRSLWRILSQHTGRGGGRIGEMLDTAEQYGMDPFWVHEMLVFWDGRGDIALSHADNRVEPEQENWRP